MVFKKAIGSYILAQTLTMSLDKIQSWCCPISITAFYFSILTMELKKILIPNLPLPIVFSPVSLLLFFPTFWLSFQQISG